MSWVLTISEWGPPNFQELLLPEPSYPSPALSFDLRKDDQENRPRWFSGWFPQEPTLH